jgi:hypothetical protein
MNQPPIPGLFAASGARPRPPGWHLIANIAGVQGFHLVDHTVPEGGVATVCGVIGRTIQSPVLVITPCSACEAASS